MFDRFLSAIGLQRKSMSSPGLFEIFGATPSASGVSVTPKTAMQCTPVNKAVMALAEPLGAMPLHVYRRDAKGNKERDSKHPAYAVLHDQANPWQSASDLRQQLAVDCLLHGNAYAQVVRTGDNTPRELWRLAPGAVTVELDGVEPVYWVVEGTGKRRVDISEIVHIRAPVSLDGVTGESPIALARDAIGMAIILERHGAKFFGNGANPKGVILNPKVVSPEGKGKLAAGWDAQTSGDNSGRTAVLDEGMRWQQVTMSSVDAQYLENRRFQIEEIARAFNVPVHLLFEMERATNANAEEMGRTFLQFSLMPWIRRFQDAFSRALLTDEERGEYFIEYLTEDLVKSDIQKRYAAYSQGRSGGWLSGNDIRRAENMPAVDGLDSYDNPNTTPGGRPANDNQKEAVANG